MWLSAISAHVEPDTARHAADEALAIAATTGSPDLIGGAYVMVSQARIREGDLDGVDETLAQAESMVNGWQSGWCQEVICNAALTRGRLDDAEAACARGLEIYERLQNPWSQSELRHRLGLIAELRGEHAGAAEHYAASIELVRNLDAHEIRAIRLGHLARITEQRGDSEAASSMLQEADTVLRWLAGTDASGPMARRRSDLALARGELQDLRTWYEAVADADGTAYVVGRLAFLQEILRD
jgi:hypothetical protein